MKLLDDIIELGAGDKSSVSTLLRKCLVLAHTLKNDRLKDWAENELNGYTSDDDSVPDYRKTSAPAKGLFLGPYGAEIRNQPIPPAMLRPEHRRFAESAVLFQPIASYENVDGGHRFMIEWPANLTGLYQAAFFEGSYALNRAWQEVPGSVFAGLMDTVRTRVLRFALELKDELGLVSGDVNELPRETVDRSVVTYILGGVNISGGHFQQSPIGIGDNITQSVSATSGGTIFADLHRAVSEGSVEGGDRKRLLAAIKAMEDAQTKPSFRNEYREFIALAADYMILIGPYVPALAALLGR